MLLSRPQDYILMFAIVRPALVLGVLTLITFVVTAVPNVRRVNYNDRLLKLFLAMLVIMAASIPLAYHRKYAFEFLFGVYINAVVFFILFYIMGNSVQFLKNSMKIACLGAFMYTTFAILTGKMVQGRLAFGEMFDPNDLSYFIISFLPFNFFFLKKENPAYMRILSIINLGMGCITVLMTGSRGGFVGLIVVFIVLLFSKISAVKFSHKVIFLILCLALAAYKAPSIDFQRLSTVFSPQDDYNLSDEYGRKEIWKAGIILMATHPLTGVGLNCFNMAIGDYRQERGVLPRWQTAHNSFIQIGAETGILGFILFILMNVYTYKNFSFVAKNGLSTDLVGIGTIARIGFIGNLVCSFFLSQAYSIYWVFFVVFSIVLRRLNSKASVAYETPQSGKRVLIRGPAGSLRYGKTS